MLLFVPRRYFSFGSNCFMFWCSNFFVLFAQYVRFSLLVKFESLSGRLLGNSCSLGLVLSSLSLSSNFILLFVPRRYFSCGSNCFMFWCSNFVLFAQYVRFHLLVKFGSLSGRLLGTSCSLGL